MGYSAFQKASIDKICEHFKEHTRVICADEAGLGKTYIARGVIEKLADKKLWDKLSNKTVINNCEKWIKNFMEINAFKNFSKSGSDSVKTRITTFAKAVTGDNAWALNKGETFKKVIDRIICESLDYQTNKQDFWFRVIKNLPNLIVAYNDTKSGLLRMADWDLNLEGFPTELSDGTFRVLYICSNLAIAEQNTSRLTECRQRSIQKNEKPDRLSTVWYYKERFYTPYLELYPISYTLGKVDTQGTAEEREILKKSCNDKPTDKDIKSDIRKYRQIGEEKSLGIEYDLIIFDEFQNFGDAIAFINPTKTKQNILAAMKADKNTKPDAEKKEKLQRICQALYSNGKQPKTLFLSATPFKDIAASETEFHHISLEDIITLLGGDYNTYENYPSSQLKSDYLYKIGLFRNERKNMIKEYSPFIGRVPCTSKGILTQAAMLHGEGQGNKATALMKYVPAACLVKKNYSGVELRSGFEYANAFSYELDRMEKCKNIVFSPKAIEEKDEADNCIYYVKEDYSDLKQLLWIPPTNPSHELGGVFKKYSIFSKSFIFTMDLVAISEQITEIFNEIISYSPIENFCNETELVECLKDKYFSKYFDSTAQDITKKFVNMIKNCGKDAIPKQSVSVKDVLDYCEAGCLADVLNEFVYLYGKESEDALNKILKFFQIENNGYKFAMKLDDNSISQGDKNPTIRRNFNSPFLPFVLTSTSIGTEGIDFHLYCDRLIHYCLPKNFIDWEQKNGRIDRRDSLAVRRWWSRPSNMWQLLERESIEKNSGGLSPHWNSGECGLHYYYLFVEGSEEEIELDELIKQVRTNRMVLGSDGVTLHMTADDNINLSPYLREKY